MIRVLVVNMKFGKLCQWMSSPEFENPTNHSIISFSSFFFSLIRERLAHFIRETAQQLSLLMQKECKM